MRNQGSKEVSEYARTVINHRKKYKSGLAPVTYVENKMLEMSNRIIRKKLEAGNESEEDESKLENHNPKTK